jgi:hypothetical protein
LRKSEAAAAFDDTLPIHPATHDMNNAVPALQQPTGASGVAALLLSQGIAPMPLRALTATGAAPPPS